MNHKPKRPRKLLLHRKEIDRLATKASERGLTIVPFKIYFKQGIAKVEICIAKGRKLYDSAKPSRSRTQSERSTARPGAGVDFRLAALECMRVRADRVRFGHAHFPDL